MRRLAVLGALVLVTGCDKVREAFSTAPPAAAEVEGVALKVDRLATAMNGLKGLPLNAEAARGIAGLWVDHMLFAQALARRNDLADSAFAADALWADIMELQAARWHDTLMAGRAAVAGAIADSIYAADDERIFQHFLVKSSPQQPQHLRTVAHLRAEQLLRKVQGGMSFAEVAQGGSEDAGSRENGGYLTLAPRGRWVTSFDSAAWTLKPGQMTPIIETPFGFHVIRFPPLTEVRGMILDDVKLRLGMELDSLYMDSLGTRKRLAVAGSAPATIRAAVADFDGALKSRETIATWDGGRLTLGEFARWLNALGPSFINDAASRPDTGLVLLARAVGQNALLIQEAQEHGVGLSREDWGVLMERHRARVDSLISTLGLGPDKLDSTATPAEREQVAALAIDQYWERVSKGEGRPLPIPGPMALALRTRGTYRYFPAGLDRAVSVAQEQKQAADSAEAAGPRRDSTRALPRIDSTGGRP